MRLSAACALLLTLPTLLAPLHAIEPDRAAAERGAKAVRGQMPMNPPVWSAQAFDNLWKQWGLAARPTDYDRAVRERYGLHVAPYSNGGLPMGLHHTRGLLGKGIVNDCMLCHASAVAGQLIVGAANSRIRRSLADR